MGRILRCFYRRSILRAIAVAGAAFSFLSAVGCTNAKPEFENLLDLTSSDNSRPVITASCATSVAQDSAYTCAPEGTDADDDTLTWELDPSTDCAWASIDSTSGEITGTPDDDQVGSCTLQVRARDASTSSNLLSLPVSVTNIVPTLSIANAPAFDEDSGMTQVRADADVQASEEGKGMYTVDDSQTSAPVCNAVPGASYSFNAMTGAIWYTPAANWNGTCNMTVRFDDGNGGSVTAQFSLTVNPVNDAPVLSGSCASTATQDAAYSCTGLTATDADLDTLTWSLATGNTCSWASVNTATGEVTGTPNATQTGTCTLAVKANDGTVDSAAYSATVTVANVSPTLTINDASPIYEDAAIAFIRGDADVQASEEGYGSYSFDDSPIMSTKCSDHYTSLSINTTDGSIAYAPSANWYGTCAIGVRFTDLGGASAWAQFSITVDPINDVPVIAGSCPATATVGMPYSCTGLTYSDVENTAPNWFVHASSTCSWATVDSNTGDVSGTPTVDGACTLYLMANDQDGGTSNTLSTTITVDPHPQAALSMVGVPDANFGTLIPYGVSERTINVTNSGYWPAEITGGTVPTHFRFKGGSFPGTGGTCSTSTPLGIGASCTLVVEFAPTSAAGVVNGSVIVDYNDGVAANGMALPLTGLAMAPALIKVYPASGSDWNSYVRYSGVGNQYNQADMACDGTEAPLHSACIHGGEKIRVIALGHTSCTDLGISDALGAFDWFCDASGGTAVFYTRGLAQGKGLRDLIDFTSAPTWRDNSVTITRLGVPIATSSSGAWWGNTIVQPTPNPGGSVNGLIASGTIYAIRMSHESAGYNINADRIAIVTAPGAVLSWNGISYSCNNSTGEVSGANSLCLLSAGSQKFLWIEADLAANNITGDGEEGILLSNVTFSRVRNTRLYKFADNGLMLRSSSKNLIDNVSAAWNYNSGIMLDGGGFNVLVNLNLNNNGYNGPARGALDLIGSLNNYISKLLVVSNYGSGVTLRSGAHSNNISHFTIANNSNWGSNPGLYADNVTGITLSQGIVTNNNGDGLKLVASNGSRIALMLSSQNNENGFYDVGATSPTFYEKIIFTDSCNTANSSGMANSSCTSGAALYTGLPVNAGFFLGNINANDTANSYDDSSGRAFIASLTSLDAFLTMANPFRAWAPYYSGPFPSAAHRGICETGNCSIFDYRLNPLTTHPARTLNGTFTAGVACHPNVTGSNFLLDNQGNTFLPVATEVLNDGEGDEDGLCESNESCVFSPHLGAYQGEGNPFGAGRCNFADGIVSGVRLYAHPIF